MIEQLPLNMQWRDDATFESFYPGSNQEAFEALSKFSQGQGEWFLYLWGEKGAGRTHLLHAAGRAISEQGLSTFYISLEDALGINPRVFEGVERLSLICIDDIEKIAGMAAFEEALFHLFNRVHLEKHRLLITANAPVHQLNFRLSDLKSRLAWGVTYPLHRLTDDDKVHALQLRAHLRGLMLDKNVGQFLLNHCSRNMVELYAILEKLDQASLIAKHRLTIPFVKRVLSL